jgi:hypothetical protein
VGAPDFNDAGKAGTHGSDTDGQGGMILDGYSPLDDVRGRILVGTSLIWLLGMDASGGSWQATPRNFCLRLRARSVRRRAGAPAQPPTGWSAGCASRSWGLPPAPKQQLAARERRWQMNNNHGQATASVPLRRARCRRLLSTSSGLSSPQRAVTPGQPPTG